MNHVKPNFLFFQKLISGLSLSAVLAGSDLHLVRIRGRTSPTCSVFNTTFCSSIPLQNPRFSESIWVPCSEFLQRDTFFKLGFSSSSLNPLFSSFVFSVSSSFLSWLANGDPQNLQAKEEDLYGADRQRVKSNAFLGGDEQEEDAKILASFSFSSLFSSSSSGTESPVLIPNFDESSPFCGFLQHPIWKNAPNFFQEHRKPGLALTFPGR